MEIAIVTESKIEISLHLQRTQQEQNYTDIVAQRL